MHVSAKPAIVQTQQPDPVHVAGVQTMDPRDEDKFDFDPLDVTKIWPEHLFPLQPVGRMVLNKAWPGPACVRELRVMNSAKVHELCQNALYVI